VRTPLIRPYDPGVREPLRRLARDDWVVGIAATIAIGYGVVSFVRSVAKVVLDLIADEEHEGSYTVAGVQYEALVTSRTTLLAVVGLAAVARWHARRDEA
jgi:hypothetical protein